MKVLNPLDTMVQRVLVANTQLCVMLWSFVGPYVSPFTGPMVMLKLKVLKREFMMLQLGLSLCLRA